MGEVRTFKITLNSKEYSITVEETTTPTVDNNNPTPEVLSDDITENGPENSVDEPTLMSLDSDDMESGPLTEDNSEIIDDEPVIEEIVEENTDDIIDESEIEENNDDNIVIESDDEDPEETITVDESANIEEEENVEDTTETPVDDIAK